MCWVWIKFRSKLYNLLQFYPSWKIPRMPISSSSVAEDFYNTESNVMIPMQVCYGTDPGKFLSHTCWHVYPKHGVYNNLLHLSLFRFLTLPSSMGEGRTTTNNVDGSQYYNARRAHPIMNSILLTKLWKQMMRPRVLLPTGGGSECKVKRFPLNKSKFG